ncbi:hypothetical protein ACIQYF_05850 [Pseudomonas sp. NPDC096917]|uniref:hypothetical protein n=1 Tax=Pseudomonas sp. NPDC096917 TaxID=3364483 RepID=UPI00383BEC8C
MLAVDLNDADTLTVGISDTKSNANASICRVEPRGCNGGQSTFNVTAFDQLHRPAKERFSLTDQLHWICGARMQSVDSRGTDYGTLRGLCSTHWHSGNAGRYGAQSF